MSVEFSEGTTAPMLVWGARAIGQSINRSESATYYLLKKGKIHGAKKVGKKWVACEAVLLRPFTSEAA